MAAPVTPYSPMLDGRDPLVVMGETIPAIARAVGGWTTAQFERAVAPGKWSVRQVLIHLAQSELALGTRARMALTTPGYAAQSFDQDLWLARESFVAADQALAAFTLLAGLNLSLYRSLGEADRQVSLMHSEYGPMTVDWIIHQQAGHQVHHLRQLQALG